ncbi:MAG: hypothetical protein AAB521_02770 [Patescibacteria group bacterium]
MKETLRNPEISEYKPPFIVRNALTAHLIAYGVDLKLGKGLNTDGHKLLRKLIVRACQGGKVSISREASRTYHGADLSIEVDGWQNIPPSGPTMLIGNHTWGGPLQSNGQFIEMAKQGYYARGNVEDENVREPFAIMQRGLDKGPVGKYFTGIFYEIAGNALNCEIVSIPKFGKNEENKEVVEVVNHQGLRPIATQRIIDGGAALWLPQGTHREPDDLRFPENKGTGFLRRVYDADRFVQLVPVRSIPDAKGNVKIVFGQAVDLGHVMKNGGINYFSQNHISKLS